MMHSIKLTERFARLMDNIVVSSERVMKLLKGLNPSKAVGPDVFQPSP